MHELNFKNWILLEKGKTGVSLGRNYGVPRLGVYSKFDVPYPDMLSTGVSGLVTGIGATSANLMNRIGLVPASPSSQFFSFEKEEPGREGILIDLPFEVKYDDNISEKEIERLYKRAVDFAIDTAHTIIANDPRVKKDLKKFNLNAGNIKHVRHYVDAHNKAISLEFKLVDPRHPLKRHRFTWEQNWNFNNSYY